MYGTGQSREILYEHDCRNQKMHQMFHFLGLGERAGSGIPNIFKWWGDNHWVNPVIKEKLDPYDQTLVELKMDNVPKDVPVNVPVTRVKTIFSAIKKNPKISMEKLALLCNINTRTIKRDMTKLKDAGLIERVASFKNGHWEINEE